MADHKSTIWYYLLGKIGNEFGVAGLMGNLQAESGLHPDRVQGDIPYSTFSVEYTAKVDSGAISEHDFVHNGPNGGGYGLAQWTYYTRKQALYNLKVSGGYPSIGSISLALDYLWIELQNSFAGVLAVLKTAGSIREASDKVLHDFENPADQSVSVEETRAAMGTAIYEELSGTSAPETGITYIPRLNETGITGNKWYYDLNPFYQSGYGLPNCTCYAWGRWGELLGETHSLPLGDAGKWLDSNTVYDEGQTPKLGAVAVWKYSDGGAGHVAIVEQINDDGTIITSNSAYGGTFFYTQTLSANNNYAWDTKTIFQGFIYNPKTFGGDDPPQPPTPPKPHPKTKRLKKILLFEG